MSFQFEFSCMQSSICRKARISNCDCVHRGLKSDHVLILDVVLCVWGNVLHRLVSLLLWRIATRFPLPRSRLKYVPDCCLLVAAMCCVSREVVTADVQSSVTWTWTISVASKCHFLACSSISMHQCSWHALCIAGSWLLLLDLCSYPLTFSSENGYKYLKQNSSCWLDKGVAYL